MTLPPAADGGCSDSHVEELNPIPHMAIPGLSAGATGLEPATSGVTGRYGPDRYSGCDRELPAEGGISSPSEPALTGYDPLPPGRACVVRVWSL